MRPRTSYPKLFKTQVVQECLHPGVPMASVALRHGINANLVRKWIPAYRDRQEPALPAFKKNFYLQIKICLWPHRYFGPN